MQVIAEVKTHSPFGWRSPHSWEELLAIAVDVGDMVSIHTEAPWHGSLDLVRRARAATSKPILAKGVHADDRDVANALEAGADYVLVVGRLPARHADRCLIEPTTLAQLGALGSGRKAVWNSRDLATGDRKAASFAQARKLFGGWLCQASNIASLADIDPQADAILVGANLPQLAPELQVS